MSVHLPKTPRPIGLIGEEELAKVKPNLVLVNAARGGIVDEHALYVAQGGPDRRGRPRRVRDRALHRQPVVRVRERGRHPAPRRVDRRGPGEGRHRRRQVGPPGADRRAGPRRRQRPGRRDRRGRPPGLPLTEKLGRIFTGLAGEVAQQLDVEVRGEITQYDVKVLELAALKGVFTDVVEDPGLLRQRAAARRRARGRRTTRHRPPRAPTTAT